MKKKLINIGFLFKTSFKKWWSKDPFKESAVIAYYAIFSMPGLLVIIITIAGYFFSAEAVNNRLLSQITSTMGVDTANQILEMVTLASESKKSIWASIIGVISMLIGATGVFVQFQKSLNNIWEVKADATKSGIWSLVRVRLFSFGLILAIAFILLVTMVFNTLLVTIGDWLKSQFSDSFVILIQVFNFIFSNAIIVLLFALMFKFFADAKIKWNHVWLGSFVTALFFLLGIYGLSLYFGKAAPGEGYGPAGSIILILLWVSYSSMIVFYGAEFTHAYAEFREGQIPPDENAVKQSGNKS